MKYISFYLKIEFHFFVPCLCVKEKDVELELQVVLNLSIKIQMILHPPLVCVAKSLEILDLFPSQVTETEQNTSLSLTWHITARHKLLLHAVIKRLNIIIFSLWQAMNTCQAFPSSPSLYNQGNKNKKKISASVLNVNALNKR